MILIDTSSLVHFLRRKGDPAVKNRVQDILLRGEAVLCDMVLVELWMGVGSRTDEEDVQDLSAISTILPTTEAVWKRARRLALACRKKGSPMPSSDLLIAACAFTHKVALDYEDGHFKTLEALKNVA